MNSKPTGQIPTSDAVRLVSDELPDGSRETRLLIHNMNCGSCLQKIEKSLSQLPEVHKVRANLSAKSVLVQWTDSIGPEKILECLTHLGYSPSLAHDSNQQKDPSLTAYLKAVAVSGFAAGNIMLFSISVWSGADAETRGLFHWLSALIAIPALLYGGQIFYRSAWQALRARRVNMDVPITIGITLTCLLSLFDTAMGEEHVYFEASVMLVFFLLIGRTLDHMMRQKATSAVDGLSRLIPPGATVVSENKENRYTAIDQIKIGDHLLIEPNETIALDGWVRHGGSEVDYSLVTGESLPRRVEQGSEVLAGTRNLLLPITVCVTATKEQSTVARIQQLVETAISSRGRHQRWADKAAQWYAPLVHSLAALSLVFWWTLSSDMHQAITIAVAVLIITCPCAFGLAIPMVQVMAAKRLHEQGVLMRDAAALERLCDVDTIVFDKTGTLTVGTPELINHAVSDTTSLRLAAQLASHSTHPYAKAVLQAYRRQSNVHAEPSELNQIREIPGKGIEASMNGKVIRFGKAQWARHHGADSTEGSAPYSVLTENFEDVAVFEFNDATRVDTAASVDALREQEFDIEILSGDSVNTVAALGKLLSIVSVTAEASPEQKAVHIKELKNQGKTILMVGDGLNDTIALSEADVSMSPGTAADAGRQAADFVFIHDNLSAIPRIFAIANEARRLIRQNFIIALAYNVVAIPFAVAGYITPLTAALAMSASSIMVVVNALRLPSPTDRQSHRTPVLNESTTPVMEAS